MTLNMLVVDDADEIAAVVAFGARMTWPGCRVTVVGSGEEALRCFAEDPVDVVVLEIAIPPDGFEVCRRIRARSTVPILVLTDRDAMVDKIRAFDFGADDYLIKPFDHLELLARLRALVRRTSLPASQESDLVCGDLTINYSSREVRLRDQLVRLTSTEYRLLEELARHAGATLPHGRLLDRVWGDGCAYNAGYLKVFVRRLRRKLGDDAAHPIYIQTEWGFGYRFVATPKPGLPEITGDGSSPRLEIGMHSAVPQ